MQTQKTAGTRIHVDMNPYTNVSTNTIQSAGDMEFGVRPNDVMDSSSKEVDKASFRSISLAWNDINYTTVDKEGKEKKIIHNMSGKANPGELLCIMGTSGAGKSTLLDILAGRLVSTRVGGSVLANGKPVLFSSFRRQSGYVMQSDALFPLLTVKETLFYAASLRIPDKTWAEKEEIVMETMKLLRIDHVQDTIVGDDLNRGLSGGEKRRVSIGVDIIHKPSVIFLDEPTSGLDSTTALTVVEALRNIAVNRLSTLIVTIHQPSAKIFANFDKCLFLSNGMVTYWGPSYGLQDYAQTIYKTANLGAYPVSNAPEVFLELCDSLKTDGKLDLVVIDTCGLKNSEKNGIALALSPNDASNNTDGIVGSATYANSFLWETCILFNRNLTNILRVKELFIARIGACMGFGFLIGSLFYQRTATVEGVTECLAYFVFQVAFFMYTSLEALPIFLAEREIFQREFSRGAYRAVSYVCAVTFVYLPFLLVLGGIFQLASWWLVGLLPQCAETWFFQLFTLLCTNIAAQAFAMLVSVIVPDPMTGQSAGSGLLSVMFLFSGFFIKTSRIPVWWSWIHYLSLFTYSFESMIINFIQPSTASNGIQTADGSNLSSNDLLVYFSVDGISRWRGIGVLLGWAVFYRIMFYIVLVRSFNGQRKA